MLKERSFCDRILGNIIFMSILMFFRREIFQLLLSLVKPISYFKVNDENVRFRHMFITEEALEY